ncbi:MAG: hypothetical protein HRU19_22045 [Pseudobacteriovorax sp.]|nr:hypothetical protein [Pseudobacteriovorax sp.]
MRIKSLLLILCSMSTVAFSQRAEKRTHTVELDSTAIGWGFEQDFYRLPKKGDIGRTPWRDDYWATKAGEIARRWDNTIGGNLTAEAVTNLSQEQLKNLSPAEKYDIIRGDFSFKLTGMQLTKFQKTIEKYGSIDAIPGWEGICHGWANASLNFGTEPKPIEYVGRTGIKVPLGSSDIKALLSWFQGEWGYETARDPDREDRKRKLGKTCPLPLNDPGFAAHKDCHDINPDTFHVILANMIGIRKVGFVSDTEFNDEVWNFPIYKYESRLVGHRLPKAQEFIPEVVKVVSVDTKIGIAMETHPTWQTTGTSIQNQGFAVQSKSYQYELGLDARGHIVDGAWAKDSIQPDTIWLYETFNFRDPKNPDRDIFSTELESIYRQSIQ